jgi:hypothetical protein
MLFPTKAAQQTIDQTKIYVEKYSKTANKRWSFREYDAEGEAIALSSVQFQISLVDAHNKVQFEEVEAEGEQ